MPRRSLAIVLFLALWFAGDHVGAYLIGKLLDRSREPIAELYGGRAGSDVVLLGNSRAYRNIDLDVLGREFGGRVANLAAPGASMEIENALFEDYIDRYGPPRILVVELSALFSDPGTLKDMRTYAARSARLDALVKEHFPALHYGGGVSRLFNYNSYYALNAAHKVFYPVPDLVLDGILHGDGQNFPPGQYFVPLAENIAAARRLMETIQRCGIETRLILSPVVPRYAAANGIDTLRSAIHGVAGGRRVWDLADETLLDLRFFADQSHLNRDGVKVFMDVLKKQDFFSTGDRDRPKSPSSCTPQSRVSPR